MKTKEKRPRHNLRYERERASLTVKEVASLSGIPLRYIEALETGNIHLVQKGPKLFEYKIRYLKLLNLPKNTKLTFRVPKRKQYTKADVYEPTGSTGSIALKGASRKLSIAVIVAMVFVICLKMISTFIDKTDGQSELVTSNIPSKQLFGKAVKADVETSKAAVNTPMFSVRARNNVRANINIDGKEVFNGKLIPGKHYKHDFNEKLILWTDNVSQLNISFKGKRISPQGAVANERKLIFSIDRKDL